MISVIGAGPVGSYQAYILSKAGYKVNLYESKKEIGKPVQCTGIITHQLDNFIKNKNKFLVNTINKAKVVAPNGESTTFNFKNEDYVVCRTKFDQYLTEKAGKEGTWERNTIWSFGS